MAVYNFNSPSDVGIIRVQNEFPIYVKESYNKNMFTLTLSATTTGVAAGNILGAAAAASTQFGLINPVTSGKNLILTKFCLGVISGTPGAGPVFHGFITTLPSVASPGGTIQNNFLNNSTKSVATAWSLAAGSALTSATAPTTFRVSNFTSTNTAAASVSEVFAVEDLQGDIIVPPGVMWLPLWSAAGTSLLNAYSVSWIEAQ